jgi:hypothetical protein
MDILGADAEDRLAADMGPAAFRVGRLLHKPNDRGMIQQAWGGSDAEKAEGQGGLPIMALIAHTNVSKVPARAS